MSQCESHSSPIPAVSTYRLEHKNAVRPSRCGTSKVDQRRYSVEDAIRFPTDRRRGSRRCRCYRRLVDRNLPLQCGIRCPKQSRLTTPCSEELTSEHFPLRLDAGCRDLQGLETRTPERSQRPAVLP